MTLGAWTGSDWQPEIVYIARDWNAKLGLVAAGLGVTLVPGIAVPALPPAVAVVSIDHPRAVRTTAIVASGSPPPDPRADDLRQELHDAAAAVTATVRRNA